VLTYYFFSQLFNLHSYTYNNTARTRTTLYNSNRTTRRQTNSRSVKSRAGQLAD